MLRIESSLCVWGCLSVRLSVCKTQGNLPTRVNLRWNVSLLHHLMVFADLFNFKKSTTMKMFFQYTFPLSFLSCLYYYPCHFESLALFRLNCSQCTTTLRQQFGIMVKDRGRHWQPLKISILNTVFKRYMRILKHLQLLKLCMLVLYVL